MSESIVPGIVQIDDDAKELPSSVSLPSQLPDKSENSHPVLENHEGKVALNQVEEAKVGFEINEVSLESESVENTALSGEESTTLLPEEVDIISTVLNKMVQVVEEAADMERIEEREAGAKFNSDNSAEEEVKEGEEPQEEVKEVIPQEKADDGGSNNANESLAVVEPTHDSKVPTTVNVSSSNFSEPVNLPEGSQGGEDKGNEEQLPISQELQAAPKKLTLFEMYLREPEPEPEPVVVVEKKDPNMVSVMIRPVDGDWVMGADWPVELHNQLTLEEVKAYIERHRGISRYRIQLRLKGKILAANREAWTLRRYGIYDGYVIQIEPTLSGSWCWESKEFYVEQLLEAVRAAVEQTVVKRMSLTELSKIVVVPLCIKTSLRVFLRSYPERIYIHTDITSGELWVHLPTKPFQLPTFGNFSVEIGTFPYYKPPEFNWKAYEDVDDMYKLEVYDPNAEEEEEDNGGGEMQTAKQDGEEGEREEENADNENEGEDEEDSEAAERAAAAADLDDEEGEGGGGEAGDSVDGNTQSKKKKDKTKSAKKKQKKKDNEDTKSSGTSGDTGNEKKQGEGKEGADVAAGAGSVEADSQQPQKEQQELGGEVSEGEASKKEKKKNKTKNKSKKSSSSGGGADDGSIDGDAAAAPPPGTAAVNTAVEAAGTVKEDKEKKQKKKKKKKKSEE